MAKLILTHDVPNLGFAGDVVVVKDGYARNYLVPRNLAARWTPGQQRVIDELNERRRKQAYDSIDDAREARDKLEEVKFYEVEKRASATDALYGAVSTKEIAQSIEAATGIKVDNRRIVVENAIKYVGDYDVQVNLHADVHAKIKVRVIAVK
ncbi:50S ribosomal protein L9 [Gleimia hominis]|uniref:50S ribosomal protein L9 n=1 Tax=Gleimia hominis TaxID=595468 RepID=UPI000C804C2E|nr:50S ribosomal protein L9 [Gleimia hominis]WIK64162.1 50S ribosomal protein L9 [Gleimia hominis]